MDNTTVTVQTVQSSVTRPKKAAFYEVVRYNGAWHWVLWSANGRKMARNVIRYVKRKDCIIAIRAMAEAAATANQIVEATKTTTIDQA